MTSTRTPTHPGADAWVDGCAEAWPGVWVDTDTGARTAVDGQVEAVSGGCADADADADAEAEAEAWADADAVPSAEQWAQVLGAGSRTRPRRWTIPTSALWRPHLHPGSGCNRVRLVAVSYQVTARLKKVSDPRCGMVT